MTVIVSVKINDGIIMAADSASTFGIGQIYLTADKLVNLVKGLPIGVMVTGAGGIGSESIATLLKDLRQRLDGSVEHTWTLDRAAYTMEEVAGRVREFLYEEKVVPLAGQEYFMRLRICGYSAGRPQPEVWEVVILGRQCAPPARIQGENEFGQRWDGEYDALDRLMLGYGSKFVPTLMNNLNITEQKAQALMPELTKQLSETMVLPAMPVQDAIDLARFMVETTIGFMRFAVLRQPKVVGGPVEIAAITKHEGFRWVQRRHFYTAALNP
jgi:hypothetical protein